MLSLIRCMLCGPFVWTAILAGSDPPGMSINELRQIASGVRDFTEVTEAERLPYFQLLAGIRQLDATQLATPSGHAANTTDGTSASSQFAEMYRQPERFRGQVIRISGYVRELSEWDATADNDQGLTTLYQAWVFSEESFRNPYVVICSEVSPALLDRIRKQGKQNIKEPVEVVGVFFKLWKYEARDGTRGAPMILAHRLDWNPVSIAQTSAIWIWIGVGILLLVVLPGVVVVLRSAGRRDREFRNRLLELSSLLAAASEPSPSQTNGSAASEPDVTPTKPQSSRKPSPD